MFAQSSNALKVSLAYNLQAGTRSKAVNTGLLRRAMVASSSLLAITAALDITGAKALPVCGLPVGGVVTCDATTYPSGIDYTGFDDVTVNVGSPAGQSGAVTVGSGILLSDTSASYSVYEALNVGSNVTVNATGDGEKVAVSLYGAYATGSIVNAGSVTSTAGSGIVSSVGAHYGYSYQVSTNASSYVWNSGTISAYKYGVASEAFASSFNAYIASATASSVVDNSGDVTTTGSTGGYGSVGVGSIARAHAWGYYSYATATSSIVNSGDIVTSGDYAHGIGALAAAYANGEYYFRPQMAVATADATVNNSGSITTTGDYAGGITAGSRAFALYAYYATATATTVVDNSGIVSTAGYKSYGVGSQALATSYGPYSYANASASVVNTGDITTTGDFSGGIGARAQAYADSDFGDATATANTYVNNSGTISVSGDGSKGIYAVSGAYAGNYSDPFYSRALATTTVDNSGDITTSGGNAYTGSDYAYGLPIGIYAGAKSFAWGEFGGYAKALSTVYNTGNIKTYGDEGFGIVADAEARSFGFVYSTSYATAAIDNKGSVLTYGDGAAGLAAEAESRAYAEEMATAAATSSVTNSGEIDIYGAFAPGIVAESRAWARAYEPSAYAHSSVMNSGNVYTGPGYDSPGIYAVSNAESDGVFGGAGAKTEVVNSGTIMTGGDNSDGIIANSEAWAYPDYGVTQATAVTDVTNSGAITTSGESSTGIDAFAGARSGDWFDSYANGLATSYASTYVNNSGAIVTSGDFSTGILARVEAGSYSYFGGASTASATVMNTAAITTGGYEAPAIAANSYAYANAVEAGDPISYTTVGATTTVNNSGALTTSGDYSDGIEANARAQAGTFDFFYGYLGGYKASASALTSVTNSGSISTSGYDSYGIEAWSRAEAFGLYSATANDTTTVVNSGAITTSGDYSTGIGADADADAVTLGFFGYYGGVQATSAAQVSNSGAITTSGFSSPGIFVRAGAYAGGYFGGGYNATATATATVTNSGAISTSGDELAGISAWSDAFAEAYYSATATATTTVNNSSSITTSGKYSDGIRASADASADSYLYGGSAVATVNVTNSGSIKVTGDYSTGIDASAFADAFGYSNSSVTVTNSGSVTASGLDGVGIFAEADTVQITNQAGGSIAGGTGDYGAGVWASGMDVGVTNAGSIGSANNHALAIYADDTATVDNQVGGTITGYVTVQSYATTFTNAGTWTAVGGNSDFTPNTGGSSIVVNSGTVLVVGNQTFMGLTTFDNAGLLSLSSANAHAGTRPAYEKLEITGDFVGGTNSTLEVGSNMTTAADVLKVDGAVSGVTKLKVDELGAPGLTTGNGILVVDASAGTTSSVNFKLIGNSAGGTLVDGAYEYALGLVPGSANHGDWYLTSRVYPGSYQFGQIGSSALTLAEVANGSPLDLLQTQQDGPQASNAAPVKVASTDNSFVPSSPSAAGMIGGWGKFSSASFSMTPSGSSYADYNMTANVGQIGMDATVEGNGQTGIFGLYVSPIAADANFKSFGSSHMKTSGFGISGYGLWIQGPWRAGLVIGSDKLDTHFTDSYIGTDAKVKLNALDVQAAASYTEQLDDSTFVEPSGELTYTSVDGGSFVDGVGDTVTFGKTESVLAKLKARFGKTYTTDDGVVLKPYLDLGINYEFEGTTNVTIGNWSYTTGLRGVAAQAGGGLDANITDNISLFGDANYIDGERQKGWQGFVGFRFTH